MGLIVMFIYLVDYAVIILVAVISFCRASNTPVKREISNEPDKMTSQKKSQKVSQLQA